jgi:hypothetical protein
MGEMMNEQEYERILLNKDKKIQELQKDVKYWKEHYSKVLNAYFELHSYRNKLNLKNHKMIQLNGN